MFSRSLNYVLGLVGQLNRNRGLTFEDLDRMDFAYDEGFTIFDQERLLVDEGEVVGTTAVIEDDGLLLSSEKIPPGYDGPFSLVRSSEISRINLTFDKDKDAIIAVAKCTSFVLIEEEKVEGHSKRSYYGTAFFVSESLLLTAGHNTVGINSPISQICITPPGLDHVHPWKVSQRKVPTIKCKVVGRLYEQNGPASKDIAILHAGSYSTSKYLPISSFVPPPDIEVDVVGYPGEITHEWIEAHVGLRNPERAQEDATRLLPKGRLTVSRGTIKSVGATIQYSISTCPGMAGSCVLYNGLVIGKCRCEMDLLYRSSCWVGF
jgi:hypothetical protein